MLIKENLNEYIKENTPDWSEEGQELLTGLLNRFNDYIKDYRIESNRKIGAGCKDRVWIDSEVEQLRSLVAYLISKGLSFCTFMSGVDNEKGLEVIYHISNPEDREFPYVVNLRFHLPYEGAMVETITDYIPGIILYERELEPYFGIKVKNIPDPRPIILPDGWPEGVYALRKEYSGEDLKRIYREQKNKEKVKEDNFSKSNIRQKVRADGNYILPLGPQHIILKEPVHFQFEVDGEEIVDLDFELGYNMRGVEKAVEERPLLKALFLVNRICAICAYSESSAFTYAVEDLCELEIPRRAHYLRTVMAELERLQSHFLWFGLIGDDMGFNTLFQYAWRDRELVMDIIEKICGNRMHKDYNAIGGVRRDIDPALAEEIIPAMHRLRERNKYYEEVFSTDTTALARLEGVGKISRQQAQELCMVGPMARASGINTDIRKNDPYAAYGELDWEVPVLDEGDNLARVMVRIYETYESLKIIEQALQNLPEGPFRLKSVPDVLPEGEAFMRWEAPRGECAHYIRGNGTDKLYRDRLRGPTGANIIAFKTALVGDSVADIPITLRTFDHCYGCVERMTLIDKKAKISRIFTRDELLESKG